MKYIFLLCLLVIVFSGWTKRPDYKEGDIYLIKASKNESGGITKYYIAKVMGIGKTTLSLCMYSVRYAERPQNIDLNRFKDCPLYSEFDSPLYYQRGWAGTPLYKEQYAAFSELEPELLANRPVTDREKENMIDFLKRIQKLDESNK